MRDLLGRHQLVKEVGSLVERIATTFRIGDFSEPAEFAGGVHSEAETEGDAAPESQSRWSPPLPASADDVELSE